MKDKFIHWTCVILRLIFVFFNNIYCIPSYLFWMLVIFRPLKYFYRGIYYKIENTLYDWLLCMVAAWSWGAQYTIEEVGEDVSACNDEGSLVIINHQSTADVPILMHCFQGQPGFSRLLSWIMDKMFKWTNFGLVSIIHGDFFISSGKNSRGKVLDNLKKYLNTIYQWNGYKWIILFPEGGFLYKRKKTSQEYARKNNMPILNNVSLPRIGAMQTILSTLSPENILKIAQDSSNSVRPRPVKWVIDLTIAYPNGKPLDLFIITGKTIPPCKVVIHYRSFRASEVPLESDQLTKWLNDRWIEKDLMLEEYYKTGKFPDSMHVINGKKEEKPNLQNKICDHPIRKVPRKVILSWTKIYGLHLFFICSSLFHYFLISKVYEMLCFIF